MDDIAFVDHDRREQVAEWLRAHSIEPRNIPLDTPLTVTVVAEGRLRVEFILYLLDDNGRPVLADTSGRFERAPQTTAVLVDDPPPGHNPARSLTWDGHAWIRHLEETPR